MGIFDSSKTRVRPIFTALHHKNPLGRTWLSSLMELGQRKTAADIGDLIRPPQFEFSAPPPRDFLEWLVNNPQRLQDPGYPTSSQTQKKRKALLEGDALIREEALEAIKDPHSDPSRKWWCFEGTTKVDCALFTQKAVVFIEGKRTEAGPSPDVSWYKGRDQVLRDLDCARAYGEIHGLDYYTLLVIEDGDDKRRKIAKEVESTSTVEASLPHLSKDQRDELMRHYMGFTTWASIVKSFDLPDSLLKDQ